MTNLEPCTCSRCGAFFYIDVTKKMPLGLGLDCPYCDDSIGDPADSEMDGD